MKRMLINAVVTPRRSAQHPACRAKTPDTPEKRAPKKAPSARETARFRPPQPSARPERAAAAPPPAPAAPQRSSAFSPPAAQPQAWAFTLPNAALPPQAAHSAPPQAAPPSHTQTAPDTPAAAPAPSGDSAAPAALFPKRPDDAVFFRFDQTDTLYLFVSSAPQPYAQPQPYAPRSYAPPQHRAQTVAPARSYRALQSVREEQQRILSKLPPT